VKRKLYQDFIFLKICCGWWRHFEIKKKDNIYSIFLIFFGIEKEDSGIKKKNFPLAFV
jgi:hypothetical protein